MKEIDNVNKNTWKNDSVLIQDNSNKGNLNQNIIIYETINYGNNFVKNNFNNCYLLILYLSCISGSCIVFY